MNLTKDQIEKISTQPDHMSEENLRLCDFSNACPSFSQSQCDYEFHKKCPIAINHYTHYACKSIR